MLRAQVLVGLDCRNYLRLQHRPIDDLNHCDVAKLGPTNQRAPIRVQVHLLHEVELHSRHLELLTNIDGVNHDGLLRIPDVKDHDHAFACGHIESLQVLVNLQRVRSRIRCLHYASGLVLQ